METRRPRRVWNRVSSPCPGEAARERAVSKANGTVLARRNFTSGITRADLSFAN